MPYIKNEARQYFGELLRTLKRVSISNGGELNYLIGELINQYIETHTKNYETLSMVVASLECAKLELYRRVMGPYEDKKIIENGEVYSERTLL